MQRMIVFTLLLLGVTSARAQQPADSGSYFITLGKDTIGMETFKRRGLVLTSEALLRTPVTRHLKMTVTMRPDSTVAWWELVSSPIEGTGDKAPVSRMLVTALGDSAQVQVWSGGVAQSPKMVSAGGAGYPLVTPFYSALALGLRQALAAGDSTLTLQGRTGAFRYALDRIRPDSVTMTLEDQGDVSYVRFDRDGRMARYDGAGTTFKVVATRAAPADVNLWMARWVQADAGGRSLGFLSPHAEIEGVIGTALVTVKYSRPSKRGRVIFGGIVPWNQVWRTGANAATELHVDVKDIMIGATRVPVGKYSLWTIPAPDGWTLIINKQTGQWGTVYDSAQDLARIPVKAETMAQPQEQFTIAVVPGRDKTGELTLEWDRTRVRVPLREAP